MALRICFSRFWLGPIASVVFALAAAACGDSLGVSPAQLENIVDTTTIYALRGTAISARSGYDIVVGNLSRIDQGEPFDFAFDIGDDGTAQILPGAFLKLAPAAGLVIVDQAFDAIETAPLEGYVTDSVVVVSVGTVFVARSRASTNLCNFNTSLPRYGKFRVIGFDPIARSLTMELLIDHNCGYRGLLPGLPKS